MFKKLGKFRKSGWQVLIFLLLGTVTYAAEAEQSFNRANQAYSDGKYGESAMIFDSLIKNQGASLELYFNLGNALVRAGDIGRGVLAYERGLLLNPNDKMLRQNLDKVVEVNNLVNAEGSFGSGPFLRLGQNVWAGLLLVALWVVAGGIVLWTFAGSRIPQVVLRVWPALMATVLICGVMAVLGVIFHGQRESRAVVLAPNAALLISPFAGATALGTLRPGEVVRSQEAHGEYLYVKSGGAQGGWIRAGDVERVKR